MQRTIGESAVECPGHGQMRSVYLDGILIRIMCATCGRQPIDLLEQSKVPSITCPRCGRRSFHPEDVAQGYCGACSWWTSDLDLAPRHPDGPLGAPKRPDPTRIVDNHGKPLPQPSEPTMDLLQPEVRGIFETPWGIALVVIGLVVLVAFVVWLNVVHTQWLRS